MAFIMAKSVKMSRASVLMAILVDWLQMLAFPLNSHPSLPWSSTPGVRVYSKLADFLSTDNLDKVRKWGGLGTAMSADCAAIFPVTHLLRSRRCTRRPSSLSC